MAARPIADFAASRRYRLAGEGDGEAHRIELADAMQAFADDLLETGNARLALERAFRWGYEHEEAGHVTGLQEQLQELRFQRDRLRRQAEDDTFLEALTPELDRLAAEAGEPDEHDASALDRLADRLELGYQDPSSQAQFEDLVEAMRQVSGHGGESHDEGAPPDQASPSFFDSPSGSRGARVDQLRRMLFSGGVESSEAAPATWRESLTDKVHGVDHDLDTLVRLDKVESALQELGSVGSVVELDPTELEAVTATLPEETAAWLEGWAKAAGELAASQSRAGSEPGSSLPPQVIAAIGRDLLKGLFSKASSTVAGEHQSSIPGNAGDVAEMSRAWEPGQPLDLDLMGTLTNAIRRAGPSTGGRVQLHPDDFQVVERTARTAVSTVLAIDRSRSMGQSGAWTAAKKVTLAMHELIRQSYPRDALSVVAFSSDAQAVPIDALPEMQWDQFEHGTHLQGALALGRRMHRGSPAGTRQIVVITDGEPTMATVGGENVFASPPTSEVLEATMREVIRCTRDGIVINMVLLGGDGGVAGFAEQVVRVNGGRMFIATTQELGTYILRDYVSQ